jgi:GTP-binding protein HflX
LNNYKLAELKNKKIFVTGVQLPPQTKRGALDSAAEIIALAKALHLKPAGCQIQKRASIHKKTFIGQGKCEDLKNLFQEIKPDLLFLDGNLTPQQEKNLTDYFGCEVWDKTKIILKIFEKNAKTNEAKTQVELATLDYMLPRLSGMWQHLDREKGGSKVSKGMGEKQISIDKNLIRKRILFLKKKIKKSQNTVNQHFNKTRGFFRVSLIGYTNVGKSSLMQALTQSDVLVANKLFATLDTTTRMIKNSANLQILLSDTVGFIHNLPHALIASFRSTFSTIREADLLLHIVELDTPEQMEKSLKISEEILKELDLNHIPRQLVINKIDKQNEKNHPLYILKDALWVSCLQQNTIDNLKKYIQNFFQKNFVFKKYSIPYTNNQKIDFLYKNAIIKDINHNSSNIDFEVHLSKKDTDTINNLR